MKSLFLTLIMAMLATYVMSYDVTIEDDFSHPQYAEYDYGLTDEDIGLSNSNPPIGESVTITAHINNSGSCIAYAPHGHYSSNGRSAWAEWDFSSPVSATIDISYRCRDDVSVDWRVELDGIHLASPTVPGCGTGLHWKIVTIHDVPITAGAHTIFLGTYQMDFSPDYRLDWIQLGEIHIEAETYDRMGGNDPNPDNRGLLIYPMATNLLESYILTVQIWDGNPNMDGILLFEDFVGPTNEIYDYWHCSPANTITVQYIESGGQAAIECEWIPEGPGEHDIYIVIDPNEVLGEVDETNNIAHRSIIVSGGNQPDCLVGYWKFEEGSGNIAYDSSGYENNCTLHGPQWNSGISGYALEFDGINDYTIVPDDPILNFNNTNQFTIQLWIKRKGFSLSHTESLISKITSAHKKGYGLTIGIDNTINFYLGDGNVQHACKSETEIDDTNWHHIVASWDGATQYLYIDNKLDKSIFIGDVTIANDNKPLEFGNHWGYTGNNHPFYGFIDEVTIYDCSYIQSEPGWEVITGTQYNMTVLASIGLFGDPFVAGGNNMAAAFGPDGENDCRALGVGQGNLWNFTIVSNAEVTDEEVISFKIYDTNSNTVYECNETILFENNAIIGTPDSPFPITVTNIQGQEFDLAENWNWVSFNVHPDDTSIESVFGPLGDAVSQVKNQMHGATYFGDPPTWWGDLENISDGEGYLVKMNNPFDGFVVSGFPIEPSTPINLIENWNWVAYYPQAPLLVEDALAGIEQNVFQVKNQALSSTYFPVTGWVGDLLFMEPGIGYKIQMLNEDVLVYPDPPGGKKNNQIVQAKKADVPDNWKIQKGTMYNMVVVAKIDSDIGFEAAGTFNNSENCSSVGTGFGYGENQLWYFTIVGNTAGEAVNFKLYDEETGETYTCNETIQFNDNSTIGNPAEPLILTISGNGIDVHESFILDQNYPNPFTDKTEISYSLATASKVKLTVYGQLGREISVLTDKYQEAGSHKAVFERGNLHPGIYYYKLEARNSKGTVAKTGKLVIAPR